MSKTVVAKLICLFLIGLPGVVAAQSAAPPALVQLSMAVASFAAGLVLSELDPSFRQPKDAP